MKYCTVPLIVLFLLVSCGDRATTSALDACKIHNCYCTQADVTCFVTAIASYDKTIQALPPDVVSLKLTCNDLKRPSLLSRGILEKFSSLQSLSVEHCNINKLNSDSLTGLTNLTKLTISESPISEIANNTFLHLTKLQTLTVVLGGINYLPDISHLADLQFLNVSHNSIHHIYTDNFEKANGSNEQALLTNLTVLDLSHNKLDSLPVELLRRCPYIQHLHLVNSGLSRLDLPDDFELRNLSVLDAGQTFLEFVDLPRLAQARGLVRLVLEGTGSALQYDGLARLNHLTELYLINFAVTDTVWSQLRSPVLRKLDLANNELQSVNVSHLPALGILRVGQNKLSNLSSLAFLNQPGMLYVNMSGNNIQSLPPGIFQNNFKMIIIDVSHNDLESLESDVFQGLKQLLILDLSYNSLSELPNKIFKDVVSLQSLLLQGNTLQKLPTLSFMPRLRTFDISHNRLKSLSPGNLVGLTELRRLLVNDNNLTMIEPEPFTGNPNLLEVCLHNNQISSLGTLGDHQSLQNVRLDNNRLRDYYTESPFARLRNLRYVFLDDNYYSSLKMKMFPPTLQGLIMDGNQIRSLYSTSFDNLPNLRTFSVARNRLIMSIPALSVNTFNLHNTKPKFMIGFNTYYCDCRMGYLKVIAEDGQTHIALQKYYPTFSGLDTSLCVTLFDMNSARPFHDVPLSEFVCTYNDSWCDTTCDCCSRVESCGCAITCPVGCTCYHGGSGFKKYYYHIQCNSKNFTHIPSKIPPRAVTLLLDGNDFKHISASSIRHLRNTEIIYLNDSKIRTIENGTFDEINALEILHLEDNLLTSISENLFGTMKNIKKLYLHNNLINFVSPLAFSELESIETITLHNNKLVLLQDLPTIPSLLSLTLSGNPLACNCDVINVTLKTFHSLNTVIDDRDNVCCFVYEDLRWNITNSNISDNSMLLLTKLAPERTTADSEYTGFTDLDKYEPPTEELIRQPILSEQTCIPLMSFNFEELCIFPDTFNSTFVRSPSRAGITTGLVVLIVLTVILLLTAALVVAVMVKRHELQAWAFVKLGVRVFDKKKLIDKEDAHSKAFDAFISYSSKDDEFVAATLVPALEDRDRRYRVCVHYRDFPVGRNITDTIFRAIENSSRTVLLLSQNFLESEWCRFEFQTAHHHILREGSHRLIIVILGDLPDNLIDPDLKVHLKSKTYLKYDDPWFWEKLYFALPDIRKREDAEGDQRVDISKGMRILAGEEEFIEQDKGQGQAEHDEGGEIQEQELQEEQVNIQLEFQDGHPHLRENVGLDQENERFQNAGPPHQEINGLVQVNEAFQVDFLAHKENNNLDKVNEGFQDDLPAPEKINDLDEANKKFQDDLPGHGYINGLNQVNEGFQDDLPAHEKINDPDEANKGFQDDPPGHRYINGIDQVNEGFQDDLPAHKEISGLGQVIQGVQDEPHNEINGPVEANEGFQGGRPPYIKITGPDEMNEEFQDEPHKEINSLDQVNEEFQDELPPHEEINSLDQVNEEFQDDLPPHDEINSLDHVDEDFQDDLPPHDEINSLDQVDEEFQDDLPPHKEINRFDEANEGLQDQRPLHVETSGLDQVNQGFTADVEDIENSDVVYV